MSEYFRVLRRIEAERPQRVDRVRALHPAPVKQPREKQGAPARPALPAPMPMLQAGVSRRRPPLAAGFSTLFDNARALAPGHLLRSIVVAAASGRGSATPVVRGLAAHACSAGFTPCTAELIELNGRPALRYCDDPWAPSGHTKIAPLVLERETDSPELARQVREARSETDILIVEGKPLSASIDSAVLAQACDGLLIVAALRATRQEELRTAAERARVVGCRTLGLVIDDSRDDTPPWLAQLIARLPGRT